LAIFAKPNKRAFRIGFVSDGVYPFNKGGKERRLWEIARRLHGMGVEVHIYTMQWWDEKKTLDLEGIRFHAICKRRSLYDGERRSIWQALLFGLATFKLIVAHVDVLDVDSIPYFPVFAARVVCVLRRKRMVVTWHEVWGKEYWEQYLGRLAPISAAIEWLAARVPSAIVAVSMQTSDRLRNALGVTAPIHVIELGVDMAAIQAAQPSALSSDILFAGRLLAHKNVDLLLRALALLTAESPELTCTVVGEGPERSRLESLSRELGLGGSVVFHDFLPGSEIYGVMKSGRVFVLPSIREGFGVVVLEANCCGLPVVTVNHPDNAARNLIAEGQNGFVAKVSPEGLADGLKLALGCAALMDPEAGAERCGHLRDWDEVAVAVLDVLTGEEPCAAAARAHRPAHSAGRVKDPT
jgi:L-malate glycosyltransferase